MVNHFWISQNLLCFGRSGASENFSTKSGFFLSHERKLRRKLTSPNKAKNTQIIACWYITYIRRNRKKGKKVFVGCKVRPKGVHISSGHPQELYHSLNIAAYIADKIPFSNPCIISQSIFQTKWLRHDIFSITRRIEPTNVFHDESAITGSIIARSSVNCLLFYVKT